MKDVTTYVGNDAHKDLFVAMLLGREQMPVTWQLARAASRVRETRAFAVCSSSRQGTPRARARHSVGNS